MNLKEIIKKSDNQESITKEEIIYMLSLPAISVETMIMMGEARRISHEVSEGLAEVHGQFALNLAPCPVNCEFCSFSSEYSIFEKPIETTPEDALLAAAQFESNPENTALFLMATADFKFEKIIDAVTLVKSNMKRDIPLIANVGDMTYEKAKALKDAGVHGVYHAVRIGEGSITRAPLKQRLRTIRNFQEAGLIVGTCVEPIGPEHKNEEIAEHILIAASFDPAFSGAARRITIPGSKLEKYGMISELRMAQIVAATRIATPRSVKGNCTHEPCVIGAAGGANLFWAETGANPRDVKEKTEDGRGHSVGACVKLFHEADWSVRTDSSLYFNKKHNKFAEE